MKEVNDCSGSWEGGIPYEVRTLLFKAVNNLIERSLLSREFVRLGKWFVQPFEGLDRAGQHKPTVTHLSFSFQYFVHGESAVCTSVDVRQHPAVRRLTSHHLTTAASLAASVHVVLAPHGMAGTLTGTSFQETDPAARKLLEEWKAFWPLYNNSYASKDSSGHSLNMPAAVEVIVGGAKLVYPTSYVLVTDVDNHMMMGGDSSQADEIIEPSPFTVSSNELVPRPGLELRTYGGRVVTDGVQPEPEREGGAGGDINSNNLSQALNSWEFRNPNKTFKKKNRPSRGKKELKDIKGSKFRGGNPMFKKGEFGDPIMWGLDQDGFSSARMSVTAHAQQSNVTGHSPASVGPVTPGPGPLSVKSETAMPLLSPHTSGPATPAYTPGDPNCSISFNPATPSTPGGPKSVPPSPFRHVNPPLPGVKTENGSVERPVSSNGLTSSNPKPSLQGKRPLLPSKEYEEVRDSLVLNSAYDYSSMSAWLQHPVKKSRPNDGPRSTPVRPMHRRKSQSSIFVSSSLETELKTAGLFSKQTTDPMKPSNGGAPLTNGINDPLAVKPKTEMDESGKPVEEENLFSADGLKPSMTDLDNMFEDSDNESGLGCVPTPPNSVKPQIQEEDSQYSSKYSTKKEPPSSLAADIKMFPTPPSHEHPNLHSPGMDHDMGPDIKAEPLSPRQDQTQYNSVPASDLGLDTDQYYFDHSLHSLISSSSKFAPLPASSLPSNLLPPLVVPENYRFKPSYKQSSSNVSTQPTSSSTLSQTVSSVSLKPGLSPISPAMSDANPRSNKSTNPPSVGGPRSVGPTTPRVPHTPLGTSSHHTPAANSLTVNLVLSDSILNIYRDINFNSCTMCVCTNEGNIKGGESLMYLPEFAGDEDNDCGCGYSAIVNRKLSHLAGMFLEDEREVTSVQEDVYYKKKLSLLLLDPKSQEQGEERFNERASVVDNVSWKMIELIQQQAGLFTSDYNSIISYSDQYFRHTSRQQHNINIVEDTDTSHTIWAALETVRAAASDTGKSDLDQSGKAGCLHRLLMTDLGSCFSNFDLVTRWAVIPASGPVCSEDIVRVMKCLLPILNISLHVRNGTENTKLNVEGPLTWRQFHRMAGVTTKGNTDDGCEPLPIPSLTVGYEREWLSVSPLSLYYWDSLGLEPWASSRDVAYIVLAPDNDNILSQTRTFLRALTNGYEVSGD